MTRYALIPFAVLAFALGASAQTQIFRCGNSYTNDKAEAQAKGCKLVEGGNVTVVQGTKVNVGAKAVSTAPQAGASQQRVESGEQKARDAEARAVLEAELKKAEARQAELQKEYNNGEPERQGNERNYQKYLDRVSELKASITRKESDIEAIKRELAKQPQAQ